VRIPILSPDHLIVCKVVFDRPKDWLDVEEMIAWGTTVDASETLGWVREILGEDSEQYARLAALLEHTDAACPSILQRDGRRHPGGDVAGDRDDRRGGRGDDRETAHGGHEGD
jgi:hypothetical protein